MENREYKPPIDLKPIKKISNRNVPLSIEIYHKERVAVYYHYLVQRFGGECFLRNLPKISRIVWTDKGLLLMESREFKPKEFKPKEFKPKEFKPPIDLEPIKRKRIPEFCLKNKKRRTNAAICSCCRRDCPHAGRRRSYGK